ncbi:NADPH-dependent FMN reductase [Micrococcoides hystricis]|uniref:NADPH-dependent FMN reductase n=1 Tax=Micrococcoides hystricis TaxID=1572761 RepID=A0ABV6PE90_9MICC
MKIVGLSGSIVGRTTRSALNYTLQAIQKQDPTIETELVDLAEYEVQFADGRHYLDYTGDTRSVAEKLMAADAIIFGSPTFQASIPGTLKNVLDLLPADGLQDKVVGMIMTAGTAKHYLVGEHHLRPILSYMKGHLLQNYVFVEAKDVFRGEIANDDIAMRLERLGEDLIANTKSYSQMQMEREAAYAF